MSGYKFTYDSPVFEPRTVEELKDFYSHALHAEVAVGDGASIDSLVAAFRQIMIAAGFTDHQSRQVIVIPHSKVEA